MAFVASSSEHEVTVRSTTTRVRGQSMHYLEAGEGPPVLLLHGLIASTHVFEPLIVRASKRYRFLAIDLPASGKSGRYCTLEPAALADACDRLLAKLRLPPALVVGHSYGGLVAIELLARHPRRVRGLVVAGTPALGIGGYRKLLAAATDRMWGLLGPLARSPVFLKAYLQRLWGNPDGVTQEIVHGYLEAMGAEGSHEATLEALRIVAEYRMPVEALRRARVPRAVLWGERDRLVPLVQGEQVARALDAPLTILPEAGHCLPQEHPEALEKALAAVSKPSQMPRFAKGRKKVF